MHHHRSRRPAGRPDTWRRPAHNVPVNIAEYPDRFVAHVYAIGFARADVSVTVSGETLYISGRRQAPEEPDFLLQEFPIKRFERAFELSEQVDRSAITARVAEGGVLEIVAPKLASAQQPDLEIAVG